MTTRMQVVERWRRPQVVMMIKRSLHRVTTARTVLAWRRKIRTASLVNRWGTVKGRVSSEGHDGIDKSRSEEDSSKESVAREWLKLESETL